MKRSPWIYLLLLSCGALAGCEHGLAQTQAPSKPPPPEVLFSLPIVREVTDHEDFTGRTDAIDSVNIVARVTGYLNKVPFKEGAMIKKGDVLFEIDPRPYQALYDQGVSQVNLSEAKVRQAKADNARAKGLSKTPGAISQQDLDRFEELEEEALAAVQAAKANLETSRINLDFCKVASPIDGKVSRYFMTPGNLVMQDQTMLTTVVSLDPVYVYFDIDERTFLQIQKLGREGKIANSENGVPVFLGLSNEDDFPHKGTVDFMDNKVDPQTGTLRARGVFHNPKMVLSAGLFARVRLPIGVPHPALLIPEEALATDQGRKFAYVIGKDNVVDYRAVTVGPAEGALRVIETGLSKDDRVVVSGLQRLVSPKMEVKPTPMPAAKDLPGAATAPATATPGAPTASSPGAAPGAPPAADGKQPSAK